MNATRRQFTILDAMTDPSLFGGYFRRGRTWAAWVTFLKAVFAIPMSMEDLEIFQRHSARTTPPASPVREAWMVIGRRGGKSRIAALVAVFLACFRDYKNVLAPGEKGTVMLLAADRRQARSLMRYITGLLETPLLAAMVVNRSSESVTLSNNIVIEIHTASFRAVRGYTVVAAICDEIAFWQSEESANPDTEILNALRPAMATVDGAILLCISSPYARRGALWLAYREHFGKEDDPILVWQAPTTAMNPTVSESVIKAAYEDDEAVADAEYGANFRRDIEAFVSPEAVEAVRVPGRSRLPYVNGIRYSGFVDFSGGSQDSMTLAIAHRQGAKAILDAVVEVRPPFSPEEITKQFCALLKAYGIHLVTGDHYGGVWPRDRFRVHGVTYAVAEQTKSDLYQALLPMITSGAVELLDSPVLTRQLLSLERNTSRLGKDSISHPPGRHDDVINAAAGALVLAPRTRMLDGYGQHAAMAECADEGPWTCPACQTFYSARPSRCVSCHPGWTWSRGGPVIPACTKV
jgi:hypothetical protein